MIGEIIGKFTDSELLEVVFTAGRSASYLLIKKT